MHAIIKYIIPDVHIISTSKKLLIIISCIIISLTVILNASFFWK